MRNLIRRILPESLRRELRSSWDGIFCKDFPDKETLGVHAQWTILKRGLSQRSVVYSGGIGEDVSFETRLISQFGLTVFAFDPSPVAVETVQKISNPNGRFRYHPLGLTGSRREESRFTTGGGEGNTTWFKAGAGNSVGRVVPCTSIGKEVVENRHPSIDLLKIDIEGFEYGVLDQCLNDRLPIRQICVEFHHFVKGISRLKTLRMLLRLRRCGYALIHKHGCEYTFYQRQHLYT